MKFLVKSVCKAKIAVKNGTLSGHYCENWDLSQRNLKRFECNNFETEKIGFYMSFDVGSTYRSHRKVCGLRR